MTNTKLGAVVDHLRRLVRPAPTSEGDHYLLAQFLHSRDEAAFAALLGRHGPMVLGVCRRLLNQAQDAEDVVQATFLLLARKAATIRKRASLGCWLHRVAQRLSVQLKRREMKRQAREKNAAAMRGQGESPRLDCQEIRGLLDTALQELPEKFRAAIILCYLEGLTQEEAAGQLGCPLGTVRSRLARGRKLLQNHLASRGMALSAGGLASFLTAQTASAALSTKLHGSALTAAIQWASGKALPGLVSASVALLVNSGLKSFAITKMLWISAGILALGLIAGGAGLAARNNQVENQESIKFKQEAKAHIQQEPKPKAPETEVDSRPAPSERDSEPKEMHVTGQVLDADGEPISKVQLAVVAHPFLFTSTGEFSLRRVVGQGHTNETGHFDLKFSRASYDEVLLLAGKEGFALKQHLLKPNLEKQEAEMRLATEQILHLHLLDLQGQPAVGVRVQLLHIGDQRDAYFFDLPKGLSFWPAAGTTDDQGRTQIRQLNPRLKNEVMVMDDRFAFQFFDVGPAQDKEITKVLTPARMLEGRVVYEDTGEPAADAVISTRPAWVTGATDKDGRFKLNLWADDEVRFRIFPKAGEPYLSLDSTLRWPAGAIRKELQFSLPRGVLVHGKISDSTSRKRISGASVQLNRREKMAVTKGDGSYAIVLPPGKSVLLVKGPDLDYIQQVLPNEVVSQVGLSGPTRPFADAFMELNVAPNQAATEVDINLRKGVTLSGKVLAPDGKPVASGIMIAQHYVAAERLTGYYFNHEFRAGRFELHGCDPEKVHTVQFLDPANKWGATASLSLKEGAQPVTIRLLPCGQASVRFVDSMKKPLANMALPRNGFFFGMQLTPGFSENGKEAPTSYVDFVENLDRVNYSYARVQKMKTDADGRIVFPALIPGASYEISSFQGKSKSVTEFQAAAETTLDLGDLPLVQAGN